jgi:hypothetical protein
MSVDVTSTASTWGASDERRRDVDRVDVGGER